MKFTGTPRNMPGPLLEAGVKGPVRRRCGQQREQKDGRTELCTLKGRLAVLGVSGTWAATRSHLEMILEQGSQSLGMGFYLNW